MGPDSLNDLLRAWLESDAGKRSMNEACEAAAKRAEERKKARRVSRKTALEPCTI